MSPKIHLAATAAIIALAAGSGGAAQADSGAAHRAPCFFTRNWQGWSAPDARTLYLGVNQHDVYRVELTGDTPALKGPGVHLVFKAHGGDSVCSALDLDLAVSDGHGYSSPLIARTLTKLTPEEVAAIPPKLRP